MFLRAQELHEKKDIDKDISKTTNKTTTTISHKTDKPKLLLICDDVITAKQVRKLTDMNLNITISFLPPTKFHKMSAKIAKNVPNHMVHYPLEAFNYKHPEQNTLKVDDSFETINQTTKKLMRLYPNTKYLNNHTGSKFTSSDIAMDRLMRSFKENNLTFLDSKTSGKTVGKKYAKKYGVNFMIRDIFLDNIIEPDYIRAQLKKAVKIAIKNGKAIAIFHPHNISIKSIKNSKDILKDVDVIYIKDYDIQNR